MLQDPPVILLYTSPGSLKIRYSEYDNVYILLSSKGHELQCNAIAFSFPYLFKESYLFYFPIMVFLCAIMQIMHSFFPENKINVPLLFSNADRWFINGVSYFLS